MTDRYNFIPNGYSFSAKSETREVREVVVKSADFTSLGMVKSFSGVTLEVFIYKFDDSPIMMIAPLQAHYIKRDLEAVFICFSDSAEYCKAMIMGLVSGKLVHSITKQSVLYFSYDPSLRYLYELQFSKGDTPFSEIEMRKTRILLKYLESELDLPLSARLFSFDRLVDLVPMLPMQLVGYKLSRGDCFLNNRGSLFLIQHVDYCFGEVHVWFKSFMDEAESVKLCLSLDAFQELIGVGQISGSTPRLRTPVWSRMVHHVQTAVRQNLSIKFSGPEQVIWKSNEDVRQTIFKIVGVEP